MICPMRNLSATVFLTLPVLIIFTAQLVHAQPSRSRWQFPRMYRITVAVDPGSSARMNTPVGVAVNFKEIFRSNNLTGRLDPNSIQVARINAPGSAMQRKTRSGGLSIPFQMTGDFVNEDAGMIWWRIRNNTDTQFYIYFDPVGDQREIHARTIGLIGIGDTFHYNDGNPGFAGNVALHSQFWHIDWDGDGRRDLIGFGYRIYEYGMPLEKELGNWVYFYKNIGSSQKPLFAPRQRIKADDGNYLTMDRLSQNMFPIDWDHDGDVDFHGLSGDKWLLFENTGKRDRNNLWILKQPRVITEIKERSDFQKTIPIPPDVPKREGFFPRGERMVDWEGDGDLDLLIAYRSINVIGVEDPKRGVIPYGTGWTSFSLLRNIGTDARGNPRFAPPETIMEERGLPITAAGSASGGAEYVDYDGDGDCDLLYTAETNGPLERSRLMLAENVGTREKPLFIMPLPILGVSDSPYIVDWNNDGRFDLIAGGEFFENVNPLSGTSATAKNTTPLGTYKPRHHNLPKFISRGLAQGIDPEILTYFTACVDFDGDGNLDLVSGYHSNILFYRNKATTLNPVFDRGVRVEAGGDPIFMPNWLDPQSDEPSHWGPQGLGEALFGWLVPTLRDWDGDGDLDLFVTGQRWQLQYFENIGTRRNPILAKGREVRCDGDPFEFSWRSKVSVGDLDGDGKADFVVTSNRDNTFYMYKPKQDGSNPQFLEVTRSEALKLEDGTFLKGWYGGQNNNGDNHSQLVDWDSDGDLDLLNGSLWAVFYYENVGTRQKPLFRAHGKFKAGGEVIHTFNHAGSFDAADWNGDGRLDLVMGTECPSDQPRGGVLHLFDRAFIDDDLPTARAEAVERKQRASPQK